MTDPSDACVACSWTPDQQEQCFYTSHVKLFHAASKRGVWCIGSDVIMKERPDQGPKTEVQTLNYLANYPEIPAPIILRDWAWAELTEAQKIAIADQVVDVREKLRELASTAMQGVGGGPCYPGLLFSDREPHGPFHSDLELRGALNLNIQARGLPNHVLENLGKLLPQCRPYVLTHCDLNLGNIMVKDGALVGILDWEFAAYYPVWYECVSASWRWTEDDAAWKRMLQERFNAHGDGHEDAKSFWMDLRRLRKFPDLDEKGQEVLERLSSA
ncbi:uncharacterized protein DSM5745_08021 [Aspergillus mulundensis]|uniref:Aminoglycoside phosphotransferase domain-containing protein n=1 Tax=Aspergillus mulundensis TaxID=1810919 RepID=A0A3D8R967_9EURO|nr:Uncharacterized protein DSM5745_08021 [Aspergillus mulundensis]RDW70510.1 Uncharacterized protein DSM5745_08021 [Aspergillus mulundensis]